MKKLHGPVSGVTAVLLFGAAAGGACGGQAVGDYDDGAGATVGIGPGGAAGLGGTGGGGSTATGGRAGQGGSAMAGAGGRGGSAAGGQGAGGSVSPGGSAGAAGGSMGGAPGTGSLGTCSSPVFLGSASFYSNYIERSSENAFDVCPGNGPEHVMRWIPPESGRYFIDTFGSLFDTVLYVSSDLSCSPSAPNPQLECVDDLQGVSIQEVLAVQAVRGGEMLVVVDSYNSSGGDFNLRIRGEGECPRADLGGQLGSALYSTFELANDALLLSSATSHECRGGELGLSFAWRAPSEGVYRFDTSGSAFPAVLALRESCEGAILGCDFGDDIDNSSEVVLALAQGEEVVIEVTALAPLPQPSYGQLVLNVQPF